MTLPAVNSSNHSLSSTERAAILIKSLPIQQAAKIVDRLQPSELQTLFGKMKTLPRIDDQQFVSVIIEFITSCSRRTEIGQTVARKTQRQFAQNVVGTRSGALASDATVVNTDPKNPFEFLVKIPASVRYQLLANEHPRNIAIVFSCLPPDVASATLNSLEPELRVSVLRRLCEVDEFDPIEIANLSFVLNSRLRKIRNLDHHPKAGVELAARLLSYTDEKTQQQIVECLSVESPEMACRLENSIFCFSDIQRLSDNDIKTILASLDTACWAPALKYSSLQLRKKILDNLAARPRNVLNREISEIGSVDSQVAFHAQQQVVKVCLQLNDLGRIQLPRGVGSTADASESLMLRHRDIV